ncbi:MAG: hypothetical protein ABR585_05955 [Gemmatimonadaceae bacterium]
MITGFALGAAAAAAQSPAEPPRADRISPVALATWSDRKSPVVVSEITLPSVVITGAPRSFQVVSIPLPQGLPRGEDIEIDVIPHGDFSVLGPRARKLGTRTRGDRVGVTLGIPAGARAGRLVAAEARFSLSNGTTLVVPIEVDVSRVRQVLLRTPTSPINGQAAGEIVLPFQVTNSGNGSETIETQLELPSGWSSRDLLVPMVLEPNESVKKRVRLRIPALSNTGSSFILVNLRSGGDSLASDLVRVEVFNSSSVGTYAGPALVSAVSHANDENGRANTMLSLTASGALYDSVRVEAKFSKGSLAGGAASTAFTHLGAFQSAASVSLSAPSAQLNLGNTGASFSDLTGLYPYGEGALFQMKNPRWGLTSLAALSTAGADGSKRRPMLGVRADRRVGEAQIFASGSHLADAGLSARRLDALGIGAAVPTLFGTTFKAEIAERAFQGGSGFGWSSGLERTGIASSQQVRITHAPGGSDAFARALNEVIANVGQELTPRATLSASAWRTTDASSVFSGLNSSGLSLRPQYAVLHTTTLALDMRSYVFDATSRPVPGNAGGGFGTREQQLGVSLSTNVGQYYLNTSAYLGNVTRTVSPAGQGVIRERAPRNYWWTNAGWSGPAGALGVDARIEQTRDVGGFVNQQNVFGIHGDQIVIPWLGGIRAEGELQRVTGFGNQKSAIIRAGAAVPLINGFSLKLDVEKNSIFHAVGGSVPWIFGARFEHAITVPMIRTPGTSGYVYKDLNGNQRRDSNEPGIAGAIVRRGAATAVTGSDGQFRVGGDASQRMMLDEASLPDGWSPIGAGSSELGVSLSTSAEVQLVVGARSGFSEVSVDLSKVRVIARDSSGREWTALMTRPTTATFESLPVGVYFLDFDLSELLEPLIPRGPVPQLFVTGTDSKSVTVTLDPRPIRMWSPPSSHPNGVAPKNAPATTTDQKLPLAPATKDPER